MPIDEQPSGPVKEIIGEKKPRLDKGTRVCFNVDEALSEDPDAKQRRSTNNELEEAFDPSFDELPDAWNWE